MTSSISSKKLSALVDRKLEVIEWTPERFQPALTPMDSRSLSMIFFCFSGHSGKARSRFNVRMGASDSVLPRSEGTAELALKAFALDDF